MLTRILTDNPERLFTQNFDKQFVATTKELLRDGKDMSVQQILRETLDYFEAEKSKANDTLVPLVEMWRKEKSKSARMYGNFAVSAIEAVHNSNPLPDRFKNGPRNLRAPSFDQYQSNSRRSHRSKGLPPPDELAARIEEAKTTARLLLQTIQSTPSSELLNNELVREFADRASAAHRSIQLYMSSENPHPDENTMLTLIETNEQLNIAMSKHQRSVLQARKALGAATPAAPNPQPQPQLSQNVYFNPQPQAPQNPYGQPPSQALPNKYSQPSQPPQSMYSQPAPQSPQNMYDPPGSTSRQNEDFHPPPGPPPQAKGAVRSQDYTYSSSPPPVPVRNRPISGNLPATQVGVGENPFSDEVAQPQPRRPHALFDAPPRGRPTPPMQPGHQPPAQYSDMYAQDQQRPSGSYNGTPSYTGRQDSAANHITMHGASAPPNPPAEDSGLNSPVSPMDVNGRALQERMGNLHV
jgi:GAT domain